MALMLLQSVPREKLLEPTGGYCVRGFSFSPRQLFALLRERHFPDFKAVVPAGSETSPAAVFAKTWCVRACVLECA